MPFDFVRERYLLEQDKTMIGDLTGAGLKCKRSIATDE